MVDSSKLRFSFSGPTTALTITGTDMISGQTISETIDVPATNSVYYSKYRYSRIGTQRSRKECKARQRIRRQHRAAFRRRKAGLA